MARGWESKSVEAQQEQASAARSGGNQPVLTPAEKDERSRRATLGLARARAVADLQRARTAAHRAMLQQVLESLDRQLAE